MTKREIIELYLSDLKNLLSDSPAKSSRMIDLQLELQKIDIEDGLIPAPFCDCPQPTNKYIDDYGVKKCHECRRESN